MGGSKRKRLTPDAPSNITVAIDSAARITYTVDGEMKGFAVQFEPVALEVTVVDGNIDGSIKAAVTNLFTNNKSDDTNGN